MEHYHPRAELARGPLRKEGVRWDRKGRLKRLMTTPEEENIAEIESDLEDIPTFKVRLHSKQPKLK